MTTRAAAYGHDRTRSVMLVSGLIAGRLGGRSSAVDPTNARNRTYCPAGTADRSTSIDVPRGIRPSTGTDTVRRAAPPEPAATFHPPGMTAAVPPAIAVRYVATVVGERAINASGVAAARHNRTTNAASAGTSRESLWCTRTSTVDVSR